MRGWTRKIEIKGLMPESETPAPSEINKFMRAIADKLEKHPALRDFWDHTIHPEEVRAIDDEKEANNFLDELYDYCDIYRIWVN